MSGQTPWSIKGIRAETREAAKGLAQRDGLTIGEWMNRLIEDIGSPEDDRSAGQQATGLQGWPTPQGTEPFPVSQPTWPSGAPQSGDASRLSQALETLTRRLEGLPTGAASMAPRPVMAPVVGPALNPAGLGGVDRALMAIGERMEDAERRSDRTFGHIDAALSELRQTQTMVADRLRRLEDTDPAHKSMGALRTLEAALAQLVGQMQEQEARTASMARELAETRRAAGGEIAARMDELSARTAAGLDSLGTTVESVAGRISQIEDLTSGAIEEADRGLHLVSDRVSSVEALVQETNARLATLMVDLSARITEVEAIAQAGADRTDLAGLKTRMEQLATEMRGFDGRMQEMEQSGASALEEMGDRVAAFGARFNDMDSRLTKALAETRTELAAAMKDGIDSRIADLAATLAERLDGSERRTGAAMERVGEEVAKVATVLTERLARLEETDGGARDAGMAARLELARITRAIDERMSAMEGRDGQLLEQASARMQAMTDQLAQRLEQTERRTTESVTDQMRALAERLQARQDETSRDLSRRIDEADERSARRLEERLSTVTRDIAAAEDRAKAVSAPLHRGFDTLIDRLDRLETRAIEPYAETVGFAGGPSANPRDTVAFADPTLANTGGFLLAEPSGSRAGPSGLGFAAPATAYAPPADVALDGEDFGAALNLTPAQPDAGGRRATSGFASPFPADEVGMAGDPGDHFTMASAAGSAAGDPPILGSDAPGSVLSFELDSDPYELEAARTSGLGGERHGGATDYLTAARQAAINAAQTREVEQASRKNARKSREKAVKPPKGRTAVIDPDQARVPAAGKSRPPISPVGMVAAAGLVVAGGLLAFNALRGDEEPRPAALTPAPPTAPAAGQATAPAAGPALDPALDPAAAPVDPAAAVPAGGAAAIPLASTATGVPPVAAPAAAAPAAALAGTSAPPQRSAAMDRMERDQQARAREAQQRATQVANRPTPVTAPASARPPAAAPAAAQPAAGRPPAVPATARPAAPAARTPGAAQAAPAGAAAPARAAQGQAGAASRQPAAAPARAGQTAAPAANGRASYEEATRRQQAGDTAGALPLLQQAAEAGDLRAQNRLARMYERGEGGVQRDMAAARRWTERAAAGGSRQAQHNLGVYYAEGEGTQQDFGRAAENFNRAARRGSRDSQYNLGAMAEQGLGRERSDADAYYWFSIAARNGDPDAARRAQAVGARLDPATRQATDARANGFQPEGGGDE